MAFLEDDLQAVEGGVERDGHGGIAIGQIGPLELDALAAPFLRETQSIGVDREHVRLVLDLQFAFERLVESRHGMHLTRQRAPRAWRGLPAGAPSTCRPVPHRARIPMTAGEYPY